MSTAKPTLAERLAAVSAGVQRLGYDGQMGGREAYKYASINAIADLARPLLAEHGVAVIPSRVEVLQHDEITSKSGTRGYHVVILRSWTVMGGGEQVEAESVGASLDYSDKAYNKAHTYARKNMLVDLLNLSTGEDPDSERPDAGHREAPRQQQPPPPPRPVKRTTTNYEQVVEVGKAQGMSLDSIHDTLKAAGFTMPSELDDAENFTTAMDAVRGILRADDKGGMPVGEKMISVAQRKRLHAIRNSVGMAEERMREIIRNHTHQDSTSQIPKRLYDAIVSEVEQDKPAKSDEQVADEIMAELGAKAES